MGTASYPSTDFPPVPPVSIATDESWSPLPTAGAIIAVGADTPSGVFRPNVLVFWSRFGDDYLLEDAVRDVMTKYASFASSSTIGSGEDASSSSRRWIAEVAFEDAEVGTLVQTNCFTVVQSGGSHHDLIHACGTCGADQVESYLVPLRTTVQSLTVGFPS